jgi:hypothetical protein
VPDSVSGGQFEIAIEPRSHEYDDDDDRWRNQIIGLYSELRVQVDTVQRSREVPGTKGTLDELISRWVALERSPQRSSACGPGSDGTGVDASTCGGTRTVPSDS